MYTQEDLDTATATLRQPPNNYNCAQSISALFHQPEEIIQAGKELGGGRAPEGLCGALYAALQLLPKEKQAAFRQNFRQEAGSEFCREIKTAGKTSCRQCVAIALHLAKEELK